jgi:hypothetical protein
MMLLSIPLVYSSEISLQELETMVQNTHGIQWAQKVQSPADQESIRQLIEKVITGEDVLSRQFNEQEKKSIKARLLKEYGHFAVDENQNIKPESKQFYQQLKNDLVEENKKLDLEHPMYSALIFSLANTNTLESVQSILQSMDDQNPSSVVLTASALHLVFSPPELPEKSGPLENKSSASFQGLQTSSDSGHSKEKKFRPNLGIPLAARKDRDNWATILELIKNRFNPLINNSETSASLKEMLQDVQGLSLKYFSGEGWPKIQTSKDIEKLTNERLQEEMKRHMASNQRLSQLTNPTPGFQLIDPEKSTEDQSNEANGKIDLTRSPRMFVFLALGFFGVFLFWFMIKKWIVRKPKP